MSLPGKKALLPAVNGARTSPTLYPLPPALIVAAIATPLLIVMLAVAFTPWPVNAVKAIPVWVNCDAAGVYPIPGLESPRFPVEEPARPTNTPLKLDEVWVTISPIDNSLPATTPVLLTVVPIPTLIVLGVIEIPFLVIFSSCWGSSGLKNWTTPWDTNWQR